MAHTPESSSAHHDVAIKPPTAVHLTFPHTILDHATRATHATSRPQIRNCEKRTREGATAAAALGRRGVSCSTRGAGWLGVLGESRSRSAWSGSASDASVSGGLAGVLDLLRRWSRRVWTTRTTSSALVIETCVDMSSPAAASSRRRESEMSSHARKLCPSVSRARRCPAARTASALSSTRPLQSAQLARSERTHTLRSSARSHACRLGRRCTCTRCTCTRGTAEREGGRGGRQAGREVASAAVSQTGRAPGWRRAAM